MDWDYQTGTALMLWAAEACELLTVNIVVLVKDLVGVSRNLLCRTSVISQPVFGNTFLGKENLVLLP